MGICWFAIDVRLQEAVLQTDQDVQIGSCFVEEVMVNLIVWWKELMWLKNTTSSPSTRNNVINETIYVSSLMGTGLFARSWDSSQLTKGLAAEGAIVVPKAVPKVCWNWLSSKANILLERTWLAISITRFVGGILVCDILLIRKRSAVRRSWWGMLV